MFENLSNLVLFLNRVEQSSKSMLVHTKTQGGAKSGNIVFREHESTSFILCPTRSFYMQPSQIVGHVIKTSIL